MLIGLYILRKQGNRGFMSVEEVVLLAVLGLENYLKSSHELLLTAAQRVNVDLEEQNVKPISAAKMQEKQWHDKLKEKKIHGQVFQQKKLLNLRAINKETESLIFAAQEQAIRTNAIKTQIEKSHEYGKCRLCRQTEETVNHIFSVCPVNTERV